ncbi:hypothetical protein BD770DRAFT_459410 [Pilaira anomala]|nr:hypothetical protein BD770DRAFT_459410 [Pilaira anomala]
MSSLCTICLETLSSTDRYLKVPTCKHATCKNCLRLYLNERLNTWHQTHYKSVRCPVYGCSGVIATVDIVDKVFSKEEAAKWWETVTKRTCIIHKIYCPLEGCGAIFEGNESLKSQCTFVICIRCNRGFCSACQSKWHADGSKRSSNVELEQQALKKAKESNWARCPKCGSLVDKIEGCLHMRCYCGATFCYKCSRLYSTCKDTCLNLSQAVINEIRDSIFK